MTRAAAVLLSVLILAGCDLGGDDDSDAAPGGAAAEPVDLDVLVYNIEYGGGPETDRVIRRLDADYIGAGPFRQIEGTGELCRMPGVFGAEADRAGEEICFNTQNTKKNPRRLIRRMEVDQENAASIKPNAPKSMRI